MTVTVQFWSYFKDHTQCAATSLKLPDGATLADAHTTVIAQFPVLGDMRHSTLKAVGVDGRSQITTIHGFAQIGSASCNEF